MDPIKLGLYLLAILTSLGCTVLLTREYLARRIRLLLWSAICFVGLTVNNLFLFVDRVLYPGIDLRPIRLGASLLGMMFLLYGFVWESESK